MASAPTVPTDKPCHFGPLAFTYVEGKRCWEATLVDGHDETIVSSALLNSWEMWQLMQFMAHIHRISMSAAPRP